MNTHEYVSLEVAKLLKQAGFDWACDTVYQALPDKPIEFKEDEGIARVSYLFSNVWKTPTQDVAQRWLRETKGYHITVIPESHYDKGIVYRFSIYNVDYDGLICYSGNSGQADTYEKSRELAITKCLEIILKREENGK